MDKRVKIVLRNTEPTSLELSDPAPVRLTNAERQKTFRQRRQKEAERMKRILGKTERLNHTIRGMKGDEITLPLALFSDDVETTIDNLQRHVNETIKAQEIAQTVRKTPKGERQKK